MPPVNEMTKKNENMLMMMNLRRRAEMVAAFMIYSPFMSLKPVPAELTVTDDPTHLSLPRKYDT